jgi:hypothetical protein
MKIIRSEPFHWHHFPDEKIGFLDRLVVNCKRQAPGFYRRMFDEDFARLFHSIRQPKRKQFELVSSDDDLLQKLLGNVNTTYAGSSVDKTIRKLVEAIAQSLIWYNRAYFFFYEDTTQGKIYLHSFSTDGVASLFGKHIQWVPKRRERHFGRNDEELAREIRILNGAKVMHFEMPRTIKRILKAQNRTLELLDKYQFSATNFLPKATHENPIPTNHFDFRIWNDTQERALYRATLRSGWKGRKYDSSKRSDFFDCHRLIRFRRNQLLLRDDILKQLSNELSRIGESYTNQFNVRILVTEELPSVEHLNELETRLMREEIGFNEIMDYCFER